MSEYSFKGIDRAERAERELVTEASMRQFEAELTSEYLNIVEEAFREAFSRALGIPITDFPTGKTEDDVATVERLFASHVVRQYRTDPLGRVPEGDALENTTAYTLDGRLVLLMHDPAFENGRAVLRYSLPKALVPPDELESRPTSVEHLNAVFEREAGPPDQPAGVLPGAGP